MVLLAVPTKTVVRIEGHFVENRGDPRLSRLILMFKACFLLAKSMGKSIQENAHKDERI
jgi:hypothetical protein